MQHCAFDTNSLVEFLKSSGFEEKLENTKQIFILHHVSVMPTDDSALVYWEPAGFKHLNFNGYSKMYICRFINERILEFLVYQ